MKNHCRPRQDRGSVPWATHAADKPNVPFIAVDDSTTGWATPVATPRPSLRNIDRFASRGVRFTRSYVPLRSATLQGALMSGPRPRRAASTTIRTTGRRRSPRNCLTTTFRKAGYYVCAPERSTTKPIDGEPSGTTTSQGWKDPSPTGNTGVGGIKFALPRLPRRRPSRVEDRAVRHRSAQSNRATSRSSWRSASTSRHMPWNVP